MNDFLLWIDSTSISLWMRESSSLLAFPMFLYLHTLGMSILAGSAAIVSFAILGLWPKATPLKQLERFYPIFWFGFGLEAFTGVTIFLKDASTYGRNPDFYLKLVFVFAGLAVLIVMRKRVFGDPQLDTSPVSRNAKMLAAASLLCWFAAIVFGRLIAYLNPDPIF